MQDPSQALKNAYSTALNNLSVNSQQVPFYKYPKRPLGKKYMYIEDVGLVDDSPKDSYQTTATITVVIVAPYREGRSDTTMADDIANQVLQTINIKAGSYISLTGFFLITTSLENSSQFIREEKNGMAIVRTLRFRHIIGES